MDPVGIEPTLFALQMRRFTTKLQAQSPTPFLVGVVGIEPRSRNCVSLRGKPTTSPTFLELGAVGVEPTTFSLSEKRSTAELCAHLLLSFSEISDD